MDIELIEIRDFVSQHHPFDALDDDVLARLPDQIKIRYLKRGQIFPPENIANDSLIIVRTGAIELRDGQGELIDRLGEGDLYNVDCDQDQKSNNARHKAIEDTLYYLLPCEYVDTLRKQSSLFDHYFTDSGREQLKQAASYKNSCTELGSAGLTVEVASLIRRKPVIADAAITIKQAAVLMTENKVSSLLLVKDKKLVGLVTDSDMRRRCLADAVDPGQSLAHIMSSDVRTIQKDALVLHAMMNMSLWQIHHLPVMDGEKILGMLTTTDLMRHQGDNPALLNSEIRKASGLDELQWTLKKLPDLQSLLANSGVSARHIGEVISRITDTLTIKLIELAQRDLGSAPVPFVWVAGGSQARFEQTSHSDQDNALILSDAVNDEQMHYFLALAKFVNDGLNDCGFIYCPGGAMASNPQWCQPVVVWQAYFNQWINRPEPRALMLSSIFFDLRPVFGDFSLHENLQQKMLKQTSGNSLFISHMAANALTHRPPLGFFRGFVLIRDGEHDDTFDIKHRGLVPIVDIARMLALAEGIAATNTVKRLQAIAHTTSMSQEMAENLLDALEFIANLRIEHQAVQIDTGETADNYIFPDLLSKLERKHLKNAFQVIKEMQDTLENRYQTGRLM